MYLFKDQSHHLMKIVKRLKVIYCMYTYMYLHVVAILDKTPVLNIYVCKIVLYI